MQDRYSEFIDHIFNHKVRRPEWFFDMGAEYFEGSDAEIIRYFTRMFKESGTVLQKFSDEQVDQGLWYVFGAGSNFSFQMRDGKVPDKDKLALIRSIYTLYSDLFSKRCSPVLSHLDQAGALPVNSICYMLWDITALSYWEKHSKKEFFYLELLSMIENTLYLDNIACVESGLHGLGHIHYYRRDQVKKIIAKFLKDRKGIPAELIEYAGHAQVGGVL